MRNCLPLLFVLTLLLKVHGDVAPLLVETVSGNGVWVMPLPASTPDRISAKVWFDRQFLGDGAAYVRRTNEFRSWTRRQLRPQVIATLKAISKSSYDAASSEIEGLVNAGVIENVERHWIVNGFSCSTSRDGLRQLAALTGAKKVFVDLNRRWGTRQVQTETKIPESTDNGAFAAGKYKYPWYVRLLLADRVWNELGVTGKGTLNVIHDNNFFFPSHLSGNVYRNPLERPGNGKDDDGNGLVDDVIGYNFVTNSASLTVNTNDKSAQALHGTNCANIACGRGTASAPYQFGIAPDGQWAALIAGPRIEAAVEWAIEQGAHTYSMSFSIPNLGEYRSHWRKVLEHGSFCGVYFVSGAGNFALQKPIPIQMRVPEDIPNAVFAAAGIRRDFTRTPFSSQGPVEWNTDHYQDGRVAKPAVCAFNADLPMLLPNGSIRERGMNGNSFAAPMLSGAIALMLSADPDLLPWDLREIVTSTALDVGPEGMDQQTGHGLINCYRAVREVLLRRAKRQGADTSPYSGRVDGDELDVAEERKRIAETKVLILGQLSPRGTLWNAKLRPGDTVLSLDGKRPLSAANFTQALSNARHPVQLVYMRGEDKRLVTIPPGLPGVMRIRERFLTPALVDEE